MDGLTRPEPYSKRWSDYRNRLYEYTLGQLGNPGVADDVVQDVFVRAWTARHSLRDQDRLGPWLYTITRNVIIDYQRKRRLPEALPASLPMPEEETVNGAVQALATCVIPFIENLPPIYKEALILTDIKGLSQKEAARQLGMSYSGFKSRVQRARTMLKDEFLDCCRIYQDARGGITAFEPRCQEPC